jgi:hypothetical protein
MNVPDRCSQCGQRWDQKAIAWMKKRGGRLKCPFCGTGFRDKIPENWFARKVA